MWSFSTRNQAHASGVKVMVWCRSPEAMIQAGHGDEEQLFPSLPDTGPDVIRTNFPAKLCAFLASKKESVGEATPLVSHEPGMRGRAI
jgi:hypothetical protein